VKASTESAFYLLELLKIAVPVCGIGLILVATLRRYRTARAQPFCWLTVITVVWLIVTFADRFALSAPARHYFISAAMRHGESFYFTLTEWLWTAEQVNILVFGIVLFVALRGEPRQHI
jgi:hypothetical protein